VAKNKTVKVIITGVGGQGVVTLARWITKAASISGWSVSAFEMRGHSKRGGTVYVIVTFTPRKRSLPIPYLLKGDADYLLSLDYTQTIKMSKFVKRGGIVVTVTPKGFSSSSWRKDQKLIIVSEKCDSYINSFMYGIFAGLEKSIPIKNFIAALEKWNPHTFRLNLRLFKNGYKRVGES
jgi:Pyruvate/2-oxoacid:ferredoxin oxidoreductase gamma subunit